MAYDVDNRLTTANGEAYAYTPANQRVWLRKAGGAERFTFHDLNGQRLAEYAPWVNGGTLYFVQVKAELYFGGKRIRSGGQAVAEDRLGSTRREDSTASRFFPWGEENGSTANDRQKFATYYRDAGTALDYANQRYYSAAAGRFLTPDPYMASGGPADPGSWNRYAYVGGDPVNKNDPLGLCSPQDNPPCYSVTGYGRLPGGFGGGGGGGGRDIPSLEWDYSLEPTPYIGEYVQTQRIVVQGIEFIDPSNADPQQQTINGLLDQIRNTIDQDCANWLLGNSGYANMGAYLDTLTSNNLIGHAVINDLQNPGTVTNAVTGSGAGGFAIVVNRNGAVFSNSAPRSAGNQFNSQISSINPGSQRQGVFTLIHEFAHSLSASGFRSDRGNVNNGRLNNDDVWRNCNRTITAARN